MPTPHPRPEIEPEHIRLALEPGSGFYLDLDRLGEAGTRILYEVLTGPDVGLAVAAVRLASHLGTTGALDIVHASAKSREPALREAAAEALRRRTDHAPAVLARLLMDPEPRVRALALQVLAEKPPRARLRYASLLRLVRATDPVASVRTLAAGIRLPSAPKA